MQIEHMKETLKAPFPWFGGKSRVADLVWERFGDVPNYVEPFFGSGAVMLGRPHEAHTETINDKDALAAIEAQLTKDKSEVSAKLVELSTEIRNLTDIIAAGDAEIPADAQSSLDKIAAIAKEIDDLNPDAPAVPPTA